MLRIEVRQLFRSNGLIDDFLVFGGPQDYLELSDSVLLALSSNGPVKHRTDNSISLEISVNEGEDLFTSLQNMENMYSSMSEWSSRDILRISGSKEVLEELNRFLVALSARGIGYSYISEFSSKYEYSQYSPEIRMHVQDN